MVPTGPGKATLKMVAADEYVKDSPSLDLMATDGKVFFQGMGHDGIIESYHSSDYSKI